MSLVWSTVSVVLQLLLVSLVRRTSAGGAVAAVWSGAARAEACGEYGFRCQGAERLRLCAAGAAYGPTFLCPADTFCDEASSEVCQTAAARRQPAELARCSRYERIADTTVAGCKGYILCIPRKGHFQGVKFTCTSNTVFNGKTRSCSSPDRYTCPVSDATEGDDRRVEDARRRSPEANGPIVRPVDCRHYRFRVRNENSPAGKAAFFCPSRPLPGESSPRCTVFSDHFCITLQKEEEDQFSPGGTRRRPRF